MSSNHLTFKQLTATKLRAIADQFDRPKPVAPLTVAEAGAIRYLDNVGHVTGVDEVSQYLGLRDPHYRIAGTDSTIVLSGETFRKLIAAGRLTGDMYVTDQGRADLAKLDKELYGDDPIRLPHNAGAL